MCWSGNLSIGIELVLLPARLGPRKLYCLLSVEVVMPHALLARNADADAAAHVRRMFKTDGHEARL